MNKLILLLLTLLPFQLMGQQLEWAKKVYGTATHNGHDLKLLGNNEFYLFGWYEDQLVFQGSPPMLPVPNGANYIARMDSTGSPVWIQLIEGQWDLFHNPAVDPQGNVFVAGSFGEVLSIGGLTLTSPNYSASSNPIPRVGFIAKYNSSGVLQWANQLNGGHEGRTDPVAIKPDPFGNTIVIGNYDDSLFLDSNTLLTVPSGQINSYLAKFDGAGNLLWGRDLIDEAGLILPHNASPTFDPSGAMYVFGRHANDANIDGHLLSGQRFNVSKFSPSGSYRWHKEFDITSTLENLKLGPNNKLYLTGSFEGTTTIDGITYTADSGNRELLLIQMDTTGRVDWVRNIYADYSMTGLNINFDPSGNLILLGAALDGSQITFENGTVINTPQASSYRNFICSYSSDGYFKWNYFWPYQTYHAGIDGLEASPAGNLYFMGALNNTVILGDDTLPADNSHSDFFYGLMRIGTGQFSGRLYNDANSNGSQDAGEAGIPQIIKLQPGNILIHADVNGDYQGFLAPGSYTATVQTPSPYFTVTPGSHSATFTSQNQQDTGNDFAFQPLAPVQELQLVATQFRNHSPGRITRIQLQPKNRGNTSQNGTLVFNMDPLVAFESATLPPDNMVGQQLSWNINNLAPWEYRKITVAVKTSVNAVLGDSVCHSGSFTPILGDTLPANNVDSIKDTVRGPYDPNDKQVFPTGALSLGEVATSPWLTYTIRFQNTGSDTAVDVVIRDTMSFLLDLESFEVLSSSYPASVSIRGQGFAFSFDSIMLPDSNINEPESHGFIKYRIRAKPTINRGNVIYNTASIYFDFNAPIVTNTTITAIGYPLSAPELPTTSTNWDLNIFPNPGNGDVTLGLKNLPAGPVEIRAYALTGQELGRWQLQTMGRSKHSLELPGKPGLIFLRAIHKEGELTRTYVKQ